MKKTKATRGFLNWLLGSGWAGGGGGGWPADRSWRSLQRRAV